MLFKRRQINLSKNLGNLTKKIDITQANLSILNTGKARAIRFNTLEAISRLIYWSLRSDVFGE